MLLTIDKAERYDREEQWIKALRLYSDLGSIEPANPLWKERLKLATRRVRLLALYTPGELKHIQESESKEAEEVDALLNPTTKPTTQPAKEKEADAADNFRIDWRETLRGVEMDMLWHALINARDNYYRDVDYSDLALGGLSGLRAVATTKGLEKAFSGLADEDDRETFLATIDEYVDAVNEANAAGQQLVLRSALAKLKTV